MNTDIALRVFYKGGGTSGLSDTQKKIDDLKREIQKNHIASIKPTDGPQAGGLFDAIVNVFTNVSLVDVATIIRDGFAFDLIINREKSILLKPLIRIFSEFEASTPEFDFTRIVFHFDDIELVFVGTQNLFTSRIGLIFPQIIEQIGNLDVDDGIPTKINIPVLKDDNNFFSPEGDGETHSIEDFQSFWGLEYGSRYDRKVYDIKNKTIIHESWD